jgi:hypothetical protein
VKDQVLRLYKAARRISLMRRSVRHIGTVFMLIAVNVPYLSTTACHSFVYRIIFVLSAWLNIHLYVCLFVAVVADFRNEVTFLGRFQTSTTVTLEFFLHN